MAEGLRVKKKEDIDDVEIFSRKIFEEGIIIAFNFWIPKNIYSLTSGVARKY